MMVTMDDRDDYLISLIKKKITKKYDSLKWYWNDGPFLKCTKKKITPLDAVR